MKQAAAVVLRALRSDLATVRPSPREQARLASGAAVTDPLAQRYLVWRRSVLLLAAAALAGLFIYEAVTFESFARQIATGLAGQDPLFGVSDPGERRQMIDALVPRVADQFGRENLRLIDALNLAMMVSTVIGSLLAAIAWVRWHAPRASRRLARAGWFIMFITPFVLSLIPMKRLMDWEQVEPASRAALEPVFGLVFALSFFMMVGPKAVSLFPAGVRAAMTLKTLLPEAPVLGWTAVLAAPLFAAFLIVSISAVVQLEGSLYLLAAVLCFLCSPAVYLGWSKSLVRPMASEQAQRTVMHVRRSALVFNLAGIALAGLFFMDVATLGLEAALRFGLSVLGSVLLTKVVIADLILSILTSEHRRRFEDLPQRTAALDGKFAGLSQLG